MSVAETSHMSEDEARMIVERIRVNVIAALADIAEAWRGRAWAALGYESWADLCEHEFAAFQLPRAERRIAVSELRSEGMSTRAIAAAVGASQNTVVLDLAAGERNRSPETCVGTDGKAYRAIKPPPHVEEIRRLAGLGFDCSAISGAIGVDESTVYHLARDAGIPMGKRSKAARIERIARMRVLATEGATSQQIADELGITFTVVRRYSRDLGIDVPADATTMVRTMDSTRIVTAAINVLDGIDAMFDHIDYAALPTKELCGWVDVLESSIRSLTTLKKRLKELTQP